MNKSKINRLKEIEGNLIQLGLVRCPKCLIWVSNDFLNSENICYDCGEN